MSRFRRALPPRADLRRICIYAVVVATVVAVIGRDPFYLVLAPSIVLLLLLVGIPIAMYREGPR